MPEFDTTKDAASPGAGEYWMRHTLSTLNQSVERLADELRETKNTLEAFVREEKKELNARLDDQEKRVANLEQETAVLKTRQNLIATIASIAATAIIGILVTDVFDPKYPPYEPQSSNYPRIERNSSLAPVSK